MSLTEKSQGNNIILRPTFRHLPSEMSPVKGGGRVMIKNTHTFLNKNARPVAPVNFCLGKMRNVITGTINVFPLPHTIQ